MNTLKIQILLMITLIANGLSLQGMQTIYSRGTQTAARRSVSARSAQNRLRSKFTGSQSNATGQVRNFGTPKSIGKLSIPTDFKSSWTSMIPGTTENKIESLFKKIERDIEQGDYNGHFARLVYSSELYEFESLVESSGYNPLNRHIKGKPSFFAKILDIFYKECLIRNNGSVYESRVLIRFYNMGARWRPEEYNKLFKDNPIIKRLTDSIKNMDDPSINNKLRDVSITISYIESWYGFFRQIGFDVNGLVQRKQPIDWKAMDKLKYVLHRVLIPTVPIEYLFKNPDKILFYNEFDGFLGGYLVDFMPPGSGMTCGEMVMLLQKAGFFSSIKEYEKTDFRGRQKDKEYQGEGKKSIQALLGLLDNASPTEIKKKYYKYSRENHPDKLSKELSEKERIKIIEKYKEVNAAWDTYNEELKRQRARE